jgi:hypothetical protein
MSSDSIWEHVQCRQMMEQDRIRVLSADDHALLREGIAMIINSQPDMVIVSQASGGRRRLSNFVHIVPMLRLWIFVCRI